MRQERIRGRLTGSGRRKRRESGGASATEKIEVIPNRSPAGTVVEWIRVGLYTIHRCPECAPGPDRSVAGFAPVWQWRYDGCNRKFGEM